MDSKLFNESALDELTAPEQLDQHIKIMRFPAWIILIAVITGILTLLVWSFTSYITNRVSINGVIFPNTDILRLSVTKDVIVRDVLADEGDYVKMGDIIAVVSNEELLERMKLLEQQIRQTDSGEEKTKLALSLEKMKQEYIFSTIIKSSYTGHIQSVEIVGSALKAGDKLAAIMADDGYNEVNAYASLNTAKLLRLGMEVQISPDYAPREEYGYMSGVITEIGSLPVTDETIEKHMGTVNYVKDIIKEEAMVEVIIKINLDADSQNSYRWSNKKGEALNVEIGTKCTAVIITQKKHPYELLFN